jgi:hypothetical protein
MNMNPPEGSKIRIEMDRGHERIVVPHGNGGIMRFFIGAFLMAWLGGWAFGWVSAFRTLFRADGPSGFILFWLVGWTVGGAGAIWYLFRILRPSIPEELILNLPTMVYDSGVPPLTMSFDHRSQMDMWKKMFKKRKKTEYTQHDLQTLRLREVDGGNRLTIDKGAERTDLGTSLSEIEREWLFLVLTQKYKNDEQNAALAKKYET